MTGYPVSPRCQVALAVLAALATLAAAIPDFSNWLGSWGETSATLETSTRIGFPALGAAAAWIAGAPRRDNYQAWVATSSRTPFRLVMSLAVRVAALSAGGFLAAALVIILATATQANFGSPQLLPLAVIVSGYAASVALGIAIGRWLPSYLAPVLALALIFGWGFLSSGVGSSTAPLQGLAVASDSGRTYFETVPWIAAVRSVFLLSFAAALTAIAAGRTSVWLPAFTVTCFTATPLLLVGISTLQPIAGATAERCETREGLRVCLTAARWHEAPDVFDGALPLLSGLAGLSPGTFTLREENLVDTQIPVVRGTELQIAIGLPAGFNGNAHQVDEADLSILLTNRLLRSSCQPQEEQGGELGPVATPTDVIEAWALSSVGIALDGSDSFNAPILDDTALDYRAVETFRADWDGANSDMRKEWLIDHRREVLDCDIPRSEWSL